MSREAFTVSNLRSTALRALNYTPSVERFRRGQGVRSERLGDLLESAGSAYGSVFTRHDCDPEFGVELISQQDMFATEPVGRVIRRDSMPKPDKHFVKRWQILLAGAGTLGESELFGRSIIADSRLVGKYVGPHAMVLTFKDPGSVRNLYTYALLCTSEGMRAVRSTCYGTKILGIRRDMLLDLPIPIPDKRLEQQIADLIRSAVRHREDFQESMFAARSLIEGIQDVKDAGQLLRKGKARAVIWNKELPTMNAWTFASTGTALQYLREKWPLRLVDILEPEGVFGGLRFVRIPCDSPHGIDLLSQRDVFLIRPIGRRIVSPGVPRRTLFAAPTSLLIAGNGQFSEGSLFGKVELAANGFTDAAVTGHIIRLVPKPIHTATVYAFLSTELGRSLLKSTAVGTSVPTMRHDLLEELPFPKIPTRLANEVNDCVSRATVARVAANREEASAIGLVEQEVIKPWLN